MVIKRAQKQHSLGENSIECLSSRRERKEKIFNQKISFYASYRKHSFKLIAYRHELEHNVQRNSYKRIESNLQINMLVAHVFSCPGMTGCFLLPGLSNFFSIRTDRHFWKQWGLKIIFLLSPSALQMTVNEEEWKVKKGIIFFILDILFMFEQIAQEIFSFPFNSNRLINCHLSIWFKAL